mmetsp:Transcript_45645/g.89854  ORF Transcript_45645/g.89854 Transcript_45645/m.89854 type:complete len:119 (-) Transcript_45645:3639-3995(-)
MQVALLQKLAEDLLLFLLQGNGENLCKLLMELVPTIFSPSLQDREERLQKRLNRTVSNSLSPPEQGGRLSLVVEEDQVEVEELPWLGVEVHSEATSMYLNLVPGDHPLLEEVAQLREA